MLGSVVSGKSYSVEQNERLRERARDLLSERYDGNKTALAAALGLSQATVSNFLNGKSGAGFQLVTALARELGVTHDALVHGRSVAPEGSIRFGDLPGWQQAIQEVLRSPAYRGRLPAAAVVGTSDFMGATAPSVVDARTVFNYARAWWEGLTDDQQSRALHAEAEAEMAAEDAEASDLLKAGKLRDEVQEIRRSRGH